MKKFTVIAARWFDRTNGNTYHSVRCIRHDDGAECYGPFQYGYGDHYRWTALRCMFDAGWFDNIHRKDSSKTPQENMHTKYTEDTIGSFEMENDYPIIWIVTDGLKLDCVANGRG